MVARTISAVVAVLLMASAVTAAEDAGGKKEGALNIRAEHPRIWLTDAKIKWLREKTAGKSVEEIRTLSGSSIIGKSLAYVITGDEQTGRQVVDRVMKIARPSGNDMEGMAICYDWCFPLLSADEKKAMQERMADFCGKAIKNERVWRTFHNGMYTQGWWVGSVAIALYGDHPFGKEALDFLMPEWNDSIKVFENVFPDGAWGEGYNYNHHVANNALRFFEALKTATGVDKMAGTKHLRNNGLYMMYGAKPDGLIYPGEDDDFPYLNWFEHQALLIEAMEYRDGYFQYFVTHCPVERFAFEEDRNWNDLLWNDPTIVEKPVAELPLSRVFRNEGLVFMRGGWSWDTKAERSKDAWLSFRCGPYFGDHAHYENNTFEIYYKGGLAIDSGRYDDDWGMEGDPDEIRKSEFFNYYQRAVAHNTILVYDPDERFELGVVEKDGKERPIEVVNDGGQLELIRINGVRNSPEDYDLGTYPAAKGRGANDWARNPGRWDVGKLVAYAGSRDFTYACGDATKSYSAHKVASFVRQFVFIQPNMVIVFDRVASTKAEFKKTWLLHSVNEPRIAEDRGWFELSNGDGRLACVSLLPEKREMVKVGGPGNECLVGGIHYKFGPNSEGAASELHYGEIPGAWRIEESPAAPATEDYFLNVMLMTDKGSDERPAAKVVSNTAEAVKIDVSAKGLAATMTFAKAGRPGGSLRIERNGKVVFDASVPSEVILEEGRPE